MAEDNGQNGGDATAELAELEALLSSDSSDKAFKSQDVLNAIRLIILPDEEMEQNAWRYRMPNKRYCVAAASYYRKNLRHNNTDGNKQLMLLLGFFNSIGESRMNQLVRAVIGDAQYKSGNQGSFTGALEKLAGVKK